VMETGEIVLEGRAADLMFNPEVKRAYLGKGETGSPKGEGRRAKGEAEGPK
jgi:hypothetical protein